MVVVDHPRPALTPGHAYVVVSPLPRHPEHTNRSVTRKDRRLAGHRRMRDHVSQVKRGAGQGGEGNGKRGPKATLWE